MSTPVGVFGLGFMGATHLKAWAQVSGAHVAALGNPSGRHLDGDFTDVAGNVGDQTPLKVDMSAVQAFHTLDEMLAGDTVSVVDLCTPTHVHAQQTIAALEAGKHVICEKPMARTSAEARRMIDAARAADRLL
ncbi:MAG: Gfo/Idh/MocA family oxidoreductase, partial [Verrucomicrobiales bacterium]|nr:Gfo/Idh/MocA family oxidoreductase [Verrucomicrobiales bacterium]